MKRMERILSMARIITHVKALTADDRLEYRPSWISEDSHVWMTFEVHKRFMDGKVMEFYAEVCHTGCSSSFRPFVPPTATAPNMLLALEDVAMRDYNSGDDSDYEDGSSCASTKEDEEVPNTPTIGGTRLILPAPQNRRGAVYDSMPAGGAHKEKMPQRSRPK
ncbi:hypothetical protein PIB30_098037 [Stylosanthes scabra]|uniref:Uncharacterized protein n=1 Tax=Stylosanthes scabra TaxID=79078 RepID=A0ABU6SX73_9FABA|nr:hypothetical protein [Stylosanthes scabra]